MIDKKLKPFQYVGVREGYEEGRFLLADDMGMFKTSQAILINNKVRKKNKKLKTLVVCPTSVKEHWGREILYWGFPKGQSIIHLHASSIESDIIRAKDAEWTVAHYPLLSIINNKTINSLRKNDYNHIILDEVHNAKNPDSLRTNAIRSLVDETDYLTMLSGTPIPNTISDIYVLMHFLEPFKYPLGEDAKGHSLTNEARKKFLALYWSRPHEFKELIHRKMLSRKPEDVGLVDKFPHINWKNVNVDICGEWLEIYDRVLEQPMGIGNKIARLEEALLDTSLLNPYLSHGISLHPKYNALDEIIRKETSEGGKVIVFTNLKEGIVGNLTKRYEEYGAVSITGDISSEGGHREALRERFQKDPSTKVLISTTVMNEGVDLTAATAFANLVLPWTPAEYMQRAKRTARIGEFQKEAVNGYNIIAKYPGKWRNSLDEAQLSMLNAKQRIVKYLMSDIQVSKEELQEMQEVKKSPTINFAIISDNRKILSHYLRWRSIGTQGAVDIMKNEEQAKAIAEIYPKFNMAANASDIYLPVIKELKPSEPWLDLAGGPGMMGYFGKRKTHVLDIDQHMLVKGRELATGFHVRGSFSAIPYQNEVFGLINCSLAFQMSEPLRERSKVLYEINRVLQPNGYAIITIRANYLTDEERSSFEGTLSDNLGFRTLQKYYGIDLGPSKIERYVLQKEGSAKNEVINLKWKGDYAKNRKYGGIL